MQVLIFRGGSAAGPKPGRAGFYLELGGIDGAAAYQKIGLKFALGPVISKHRSDVNGPAQTRYIERG